MQLKILDLTHVLIENYFIFKILNTFILNCAYFSITLTCFLNLLKLYMCQKNSMSFCLSFSALKYFFSSSFNCYYLPCLPSQN